MRQTDPFRFLGGSENQTTGHQVETFHLISQKTFQIEFINFFMLKQRQFQVLLLRHSRIKPTSSLNPMSVEESSPSSVQRHSSNGKREAKGGAQMDATFPTH